LNTLPLIESEEQDQEKIPSSKVDFGETKNNFVKSQRTALRMMPFFHVSVNTSKYMHN
jgi:hypothetical protein